MLRRLALIVGGVALGAAAVHAAIWWAATGRLIDEAEAVIAAERSAGHSVSHAPLRRSGYPLAARVTMPDLRYAGRLLLPGGAALPVVWRAREATLVLMPQAPRSLGIEIACPCEGGAGGAPPLPIDAVALRAEVPLTRDDAGPTLLGRGIVLYTPEGTFTVEEFRARVPGRGVASVSAEALGIELPPPDRQWPLGQRVAQAAVQVTLRGVLPAGPTPARALATWRDQGGALAFEHVSLAWGPLSVRGAATLRLDEALQPGGTGTATLSGFGPALDQLVASGAIARRPAALARLALTAASRPGAGGDRVVDLALAIEDRTLSVARIPLARLPPIAWPD